MQRIRDAYKKTAHKRTAPSSDDDEVVFARPSWIAPRAKISAMIPVDELRRMQAGLQRIREEEATRTNDDLPIERSTTSSPSSPQPEGCPLTQPEDDDDDDADDGSDSTDDETPVLFVLPDTTVIVSPHDTPAVFKPRTPNEDMTQEVCDVILEEVIGRKITLERQNSRLSLETTTHNVCQDVAVTITSTDWQKGVRRHLRLESK